MFNFQGYSTQAMSDGVDRQFVIVHRCQSDSRNQYERQRQRDDRQ